MLSIIIPTCNRNALLSDCLRQLSPDAQKPDGFEYEVIVTDDSQDEQAKNLLEQSFPWATWSKGPCKGPAANRNNGAKQAKGDWLIFLDDDCVPHSTLLKAYYDIIRTNPKCEVVEGSIYSDKQIKLLYIAPVNVTGGHLWSCNFAIKTSVFKKLDGFDENYKFPNLEDNDLNKRLIRQRSVILFAKDAKVYHAPRPVASPKKLAQRHESWLYFHSKFGEPKTINTLLKTVIRARLNAIYHAPKNLTSLKAFLLLFSELYHTIQYSKQWKRSNNLPA
ncbi:glycosyltransferase family 2 protein [Mucilaginibacter myungsuensis]|uniref:Glycosyltransferase n=1 Tax=Mucilaginibacter myungsuensis TaxID=649104 RepID=A0A929KTZ1_9SPHI|nr:glycosyltransferase [Mucilaginibacter myungsuensis]MBE9660385.1 glycosyltransferase [Mucilaginibacter myungsuensis]MDN3600427.1 glycosyltransferase [Mucilaginibacter myungsuensis]